jgi:predicted transcriptional regulator of viral defense system
MKPSETGLVNFLKKKGGIASYADIMQAGFSKALLKSIVNSGRIQKVNRGLYKLSDGLSLSNPDLVVVSIKISKGVVCLLSALSFHEATNEVPRYVYMAIPRGSHANKIAYPPVKIHRFSPNTWGAGIEGHKIGEYNIRVYSLAKTVADCFKFRFKIGVDTARQALKVALEEKGVEPTEIMKYAKICRVHRIIKPLIETML